MQTGISAASLYPMETENALIHLSGIGYTLFEIFFNALYETTPEFCDLLNKLKKERGFRIKSVHPYTSAMESMLLFERYDRRTKEGLDFYARYMEAANRIGAEILVLHGQRIGSGSLSDSEYFDRYHTLYNLGRQYGVTVAQENVRLFRSSKTDFIRRMKEELGNECAFVLDTKQAVLSGVDPLEMCGAMGDRLVHVHLSDHTADKSCLLPGEGTYDFTPLLNALTALNYSGDIITEVYRSAITDDRALEKSLFFTKNIFE